MFITFLVFFSWIEPLALIVMYWYTRTQSFQKQIVEYDINSEYPEEDSTVDKVGRENLLARKPGVPNLQASSTQRLWERSCLNFDYC